MACNSAELPAAYRLLTLDPAAKCDKKNFITFTGDNTVISDSDQRAKLGDVAQWCRDNNVSRTKEILDDFPSKGYLLKVLPRLTFPGTHIKDTLIMVAQPQRHSQKGTAEAGHPEAP